MIALHQIAYTIVVGVFFLGATQVASAAEIAGMEILFDGKHVAGYAITYDGESEAEMWLLLKKNHLTFERDFVIPVDRKDGKTATLKGKIEIRTTRRNKPGSGTTTKQLELVQRSNKWFVSGRDVDRTFKAAGLKKP